MTVPLADLVADARHLRAWLESLPPDAVAGTRVAAKDCPIAQLLHAHGLTTGCVGLSWAYVDNTPDADGVRLSDALVQFRRLVDRPRTRTPLTARKCLALLDRAEREVGAC